MACKTILMQEYNSKYARLHARSRLPGNSHLFYIFHKKLHINLIQINYSFLDITFIIHLVGKSEEYVTVILRI